MARWPHRLLAGALVVGAVIMVPGVAASDPAAPRTGAVTADGMVTDGAWHVEHPSLGIYRIEGSHIDVTRWDAAADVSMLPVGRGVVEIRFGEDDSRVDSGFSFVAG